MHCFYLNYDQSAFPRRIILAWLNKYRYPMLRCPIICLITNKINRCHILALLKTKLNASKKRNKQTYEMRYMPNVLLFCCISQENYLFPNMSVVSIFLMFAFKETFMQNQRNETVERLKWRKCYVLQTFLTNVF